jgi:pimeloyl-ACP methyl ester carboxylesterase
MSKLQLQTSATADQSSYSMAAPALGLSHPSRSFSAPQGDFRVLSPTHPGFDGTPRPDWLTTIGGLAEVYDKLLDQLQFSDVAVISSSIGGGIAAELAIPGARFQLLSGTGHMPMLETPDQLLAAVRVFVDPHR